jgi:hypothetical protein
MTTMSKVNANALKVLSDVMQERKWYGDHIERRKANGYKSLLRQGRLSYEKACELLELIGYKKVQEEVWKKN